MKFVVTGAAGFIGSTLVDQLAADSTNRVIAVDCFLSDSYSAESKRVNIEAFNKRENVEFHQIDLRKDYDASILDGASCLINEAAMPGLVKSWNDFDLYMSCNVSAVDRLCKELVRRDIPLVQISTSSVYGVTATGDEDSALKPTSPYGISKLAAEKLIDAYATQFGLRYTTLRYFSVYGPRQRPDMAYHLICQSIIEGKEFTVFGDGSQSRSNTFVSDVVDATIIASTSSAVNEVYNIGGSQEVSLLEVISHIESVVGKRANFHYGPPRPGDQLRTMANIEKVKKNLNWSPKISLQEGLEKQIRWQRNL
jgi:nucleoside-diphosphate-sugar epimerase